MLKKTKRTSFEIPQELFLEAYDRVRKNKGAAGVDKESLSDFSRNLKDNLYKLWNRMSAGSYFPPAVKAVPIPKKSGGTRILGIPTVGDRVAQMVIKMIFEPLVEPEFLEDSYGYRPNKSALDAISIIRTRCWKQDWVLEFDIKGLFDNIPHDLLMKAVRKHTELRQVTLYIERWLKAPMQNYEGELRERNCGTPQGGVISPLLSNLFLHYTFDKWLKLHYPALKWCRYADDGLIHCKSKEEAEHMLQVLEDRFGECGLELHPEKTKIVYCKDANRKGEYENQSFDFLGYTFHCKMTLNRKTQKVFLNFVPSVSDVSIKAMRKKTREMNWQRRSDLSLDEIAQASNPVLRGWLQYYGVYSRSSLASVFNHFNGKLLGWLKRKYKHLRGKKVKAGKVLAKISKSQPNLFAHWKIGMRATFA